MNREEYIKKWLNNTLSEEERKEFERTTDFSFLQGLDKSLQRFRAPELDISREIERLEGGNKKHASKVVSWPNMWVRVAASILIAVSAGLLYLFISSPAAPVEVSSLEKTVLYLPDSSFVALNAQSSLSYDGDSWEKSRQVELLGEAFFQVKSGSTFDVITTSGTVSVVGTQFNVKQRKDFFEVNCFEGKVKVLAFGKEVFLGEDKSLRVLNGVIQPVEIELSDFPDWRGGESKFKSVPFIQVVRELERQYKVSIKTANIDTRQLFTGAFTHDNINLALKSISLPLNLSYQIEENQVQISADQ